ncbi:MAG: electron transfer flavoprotein subunit alpha/FixB family protein [Betaproteobacteria bacterium]|nr:electron transfer flavoprotein subunit alpha/FixB family protein [Betaproteobacteria bacterium]
MSSLVIAEHDNQTLKSATLHALGAAQKLGGDIDVLVAGAGCAAAAQAAAAVPGVKKVLIADAPHHAGQLAETLASLVVGLAPGYSHILAAATSSGKNVMPRIAALLDSAQISEIVAVVSPDTFVRPIYAGNALATVQSKDKIKVITVRTTGFDAVAASGGSAAIEAIAPGADSGLSALLGREIAKLERPELTAARVVVSGGRGMGSGEGFKVLDPLADRLNGALGASRAAVDAGYVPNDWQVGQTGKIVKDEEAPIFQVADYGIVGDLFKIVPELVKELG